ncbi:IS3 family transposase [Streptomyces sp. NPDC046161]|uniref:IS3 family transposase n=1 Tax=Streptomyces sp. NPDC046161 TaxID=3155132 RepID=UPI0033CFDC43
MGNSGTAGSTETTRPRDIRPEPRNLRPPENPRGAAPLGHRGIARTCPHRHARARPRPCQPRPWRPAITQADGARSEIPDLLQRDFTATEPGTKLVGDTTYIPTGEGFLYLATVIECHLKMIAGWAMDDHYKTPLIEAAMDSAAKTIDIQKGCIFHSDRGSNYTSYDFGRTFRQRDMRRSVGRTGICYDNAMVESFFGALKNEWIDRMKFSTREESRREVFWYIEGFYNRRRLHSSLGYRTPLEVHEEFTRLELAA